MKDKNLKIQGVYPALVTPLNADETINTTVLRQLVADLKAQGADGFYIGGATGEGMALSVEARSVLTKETVAAVAKEKPVIVQVASMHFPDMVTLAKHAEAAGADAISATAPLFFAYDENDVYAYYKKLAEAVHIPLMVYYNPAVRFPISAAFAKRLFEIDNVTAIKWTSTDFYQLSLLKELTQDEMTIMNGFDEMLLSGLCAGADGGIGSTYNYQLANVRGVYDSFREGNIEKAGEYQRLVVEVVAACFSKYAGVPPVKAVLECMGYAVGNAAFPMKRISPEEKQKIFDGVRAYL